MKIANEWALWGFKFTFAGAMFIGSVIYNFGQMSFDEGPSFMMFYGLCFFFIFAKVFARIEEKEEVGQNPEDIEHVLVFGDVCMSVMLAQSTFSDWLSSGEADDDLNLKIRMFTAGFFAPYIMGQFVATLRQDEDCEGSNFRLVKTQVQLSRLGAISLFISYLVMSIMEVDNYVFRYGEHVQEYVNNNDTSAANWPDLSNEKFAVMMGWATRCYPEEEQRPLYSFNRTTISPDVLHYNYCTYYEKDFDYTLFPSKYIRGG